MSTADCRAGLARANFHAHALPLDKDKLDQFQSFILVAPVLLFSMVAHEYAHGYAALKQGDSTAYSLGRLTWNLLPHIDLLMTIVLPLLTSPSRRRRRLCGGAQPTPRVSRNYRRL